MIPAYVISADGSDITDIINDRLLMLRITDEAGESSDTIEIQLDDRDGRIQWPSTGAQLSVSIGYQNDELSQPRIYIVDEIALEGLPATMGIRGKAADMTASLKAHTTRHWENITLGDMVAVIASQHALSPKVSSALSSIYFANLDQTDESDLHFLTRIARDYDAIVKPVNGFLVFAIKGDAQSVSGKSITPISLRLNEVLRYQFTQAQRGSYSSVKAYWHDGDLAQREEVLVGEDEPVYTLRHPFIDNEQARAAATKKLTQLVRGTATLSLMLIGNNRLQAEGKITVTDARVPLQGDWVITRVEHSLDGQGFQSRAELETPNS